MSEQAVSLKLDADATGLKSEVQASGRAMEELAGQGTEAAEQIESSVSGASGAWEQHSGVINAAAAAMGAAGAAMEGFARSQNDATVELGRTSTVTGIQTDALRDLAADTANVTFATEDVIGTFHSLGRQGIDTEADLQRVANVWDMVADATGENVVQLAESSVALRTLGIDAREPEQALDALGFITQRTTGSVGEFLTFIERTGPELKELGMDIDDAAALMGVLETEMGMTGRVARTEFRQAVNEANGDMSTMLDILGVTPESFDAMRGSVEGSSQALEDNAAAFAESFTPLQRLTAAADEAMLKYGGLAEAAGMLSPVLMGAGGAVFGINQVIQAKGRMAASAGRAATALRGVSTLLMGPWGVALAAATVGVGLFMNAKREARQASEEFTATLDIETGALGENSRAHIASNLEREGLVDTARTLGLSVDTLVDAILGEEDAMRRVTLATSEANDTQEEWRGNTVSTTSASAELQAAIENLAGARGEDIEAARRQAEVVAESEGVYLDAAHAADDGLTNAMYNLEAAHGDAAHAARDDAEATLEFGGAADDAAESVEELEDSLNRYLDSVRAATDPVFALDKALQDVDDAQSNLTEVMNDAESTQREQEDAAFDLAKALADLERVALDSDRSFEEFEAQLDRWVDQGRLTADEADVIRGRVAELTEGVEDYDGDYVANVIAQTETAEERIRRVQALIESIPSRISTTLFLDASSYNRGIARAGATGTLQARSDGGPVWPGEPFLVGEEGPELVTFGESGFVHDAATTAQAVTPATGAGVTTSSRGVGAEMRIVLEMDGRTIAEVPAFIDALEGELSRRGRDRAA